MKWLHIGSVFTVVFGYVACSASTPPAAEMVYDARLQVNIAKTADAQRHASSEVAEAEEMLTQAETVLNQNQKEAYRLGLRSYLKAKVAEEMAIASQIEAQADEAETELQLKLEAVEVARRQLEDAKRQLERLKSTPEQ